MVSLGLSFTYTTFHVKYSSAFILIVPVLGVCLSINVVVCATHSSCYKKWKKNEKQFDIFSRILHPFQRVALIMEPKVPKCPAKPKLGFLTHKIMLTTKGSRYFCGKYILTIWWLSTHEFGCRLGVKYLKYLNANTS